MMKGCNKSEHSEWKSEWEWERESVWEREKERKKAEGTRQMLNDQMKSIYLWNKKWYLLLLIPRRRISEWVCDFAELQGRVVSRESLWQTDRQTDRQTDALECRLNSEENAMSEGLYLCNSIKVWSVNDRDFPLSEGVYLGTSKEQRAIPWGEVEDGLDWMGHIVNLSRHRLTAASRTERAERAESKERSS